MVSYYISSSEQTLGVSWCIQSPLQHHKNLYFQILFMRSRFAFCSERMKTIWTIEITIIFDVIPLNNADNFLLQGYAIFLHLESSKEWFVFNDLNCVSKCRQDIYSFLS